jgi:hypothetical protein
MVPDAHDFPECDVPSCVQSHPLSYLLARAFWAFWTRIWTKILSLKTCIILELLQTQSLEPSFGAHHCLGTSTFLSLFNQVTALSLAETSFAQINGLQYSNQVPKSLSTVTLCMLRSMLSLLSSSWYVSNTCSPFELMLLDADSCCFSLDLHHVEKNS